MTPKLKLIFLDVDGVLNSEDYYESGRYDKTRKEDDIDPRAVEYINSLIEQTGAKVVMSSSWSYNEEPEKMQKLLEDFGFKGEVIGCIERHHNDFILRGNEIHKWIKDHEMEIDIAYYDYKHYVILDDDTDMLYWQKDNFIWIDRTVGITKGVVWRATKILNNTIGLEGID